MAIIETLQTLKPKCERPKIIIGNSAYSDSKFVMENIYKKYNFSETAIFQNEISQPRKTNKIVFDKIFPNSIYEKIENEQSIIAEYMFETWNYYFVNRKTQVTDEKNKFKYVKQDEEIMKLINDLGNPIILTMGEHANALHTDLCYRASTYHPSYQGGNHTVIPESFKLELIER